MRLFTAIDIPEAWRAEANRVRQQLAPRFDAELRFVAREQLHVTARFLGEVDADVVPNLVRAIEAVPRFEIELELAPAGTFGRASRPTVVWLGVSIAEVDSVDLLGDIDGALAAAGLTSPETSWRPHLTLARVRRQASVARRGELSRAVRDLPPPAANRHLASGFSLYQSDLRNSEPHHELLARSAIS